jgi:hypothetical protein
MKKVCFFRLAGQGYLHDLVRLKGKLFARIKVITDFDFGNKKSDEVWVDCEIIEANHQLCINTLLGLMRPGDSLMVKFSAGYSRLVDAFSGQTPQDPSFIVSLCGKLLSLDECYINGQLVPGLVPANTLKAIA